MRAHINCENLPIYTAIVVALLAARVSSPILDGLAFTILVARICQSSIHLLLEQTNMVAGIRFAFYFLQAISMIAMGILVAISHGKEIGCASPSLKSASTHAYREARLSNL